MNTKNYHKAYGGGGLTDLTDINNVISSVADFTVFKGRIYVAGQKTVAASAVNLINDFTTPQSAFQLVISNAKTNITAITTFNNRVIVFTKTSMHEILGDSVDNVVLNDIQGGVGCVSPRSIVQCQNRLYWWAEDGAYEYNGASIVKIYEPYPGNGVEGGITSYTKSINKDYFIRICAGTYFNKVYFGITSGTDTKNNLILVFDTTRRTWFVQDGYINCFTTSGTVLYGSDSRNKADEPNKYGTIWNMNGATNGAGDDTTLSYNFTSKVFTENTLSKNKNLDEIWISFKLLSPEASAIFLDISSAYTGNTWQTIWSSNELTDSASPVTARVLIPPSKGSNLDAYRYRIIGLGQVEIYRIERVLRMKG